MCIFSCRSNGNTADSAERSDRESLQYFLPRFDVLASFVALQNISFQDSLDCYMDSSRRCIKQVCKFPSGHPYFAIRNMDALSVVEYDSSFHSSIYLSDILLAVSRFLELTKSAYI